MFDGIRIFSSDAIWRQILGDLGAVIVDAPSPSVLNFDDLAIDCPASMMQLRAVIFGALDNPQVINDIVGGTVDLSPLQRHIVTLLYKSGGMNAADLKVALGYAPDAATHAVDTAIYGLRKVCGHDFIVNINGIYKLGRV